MSHDRNEDEALRFENELKKLKLQAERGASFTEGEGKLSAEQESKWLDYIAAFEEAADKRQTAKVWDILDQPPIILPDDLNDEQLAQVLDITLDLMQSRGIDLSVIYDVTDRELYRFIVEELYHHEMDVIDIPGMMTCFTYEEFHPNHIEDIKESTSEFIDMLMSRSFEFIDYQLDKKIRYENRGISDKKFVKLISGKMETCPLTLKSFGHCEVTITEDKAKAKANILLTDTANQTVSAIAELGFKSQYGYWYIDAATLPWID